MKKLILILFVNNLIILNAQNYTFEPSEEFPYGQLNPEAPKELVEYKELIGTCNCKSYTKKKDGVWDEPVDMTWTFKYIMNGMAIQDETLKADGTHSGSIRQYDAENNKWFVHYYTTTRVTKTLSSWEGKRKTNKIVLYKEQQAPNGTDGYYRLTFSEISNTGYNWIGEWVDKSEKVAFPTWKITCKKKK